MELSNVILIAAGIVIAALLIAVIVVIRGGANRFQIDIGGQTPRASGGNDMSTDTGFKSRLLGLGAFSTGVIAVLLGKLWSMQLVSSDEYAQRAEQNRTRTITTAAMRGRILDRNGEELVTNRPSLTVVAIATVAEDDIEVQMLANLLGMPKKAVQRKIVDATEGAQSAHTVAVDVSRRVVAYIGEHADLFEGVSVEERSQRHYPKGDLAAHVLGYTGSPTKEQLEAAQEASGEEAIAYESGDIVGQAGIEYQYESVLQGIRGEQKVFVDANGRVTDYSTSVAAQSGSDIVLTIDSKIQKAAEEGLARAIEIARSNGNKECRSGACMVLDATNGDVLAMASAPKFSPSVFVGGISNDDWEELSSDDSGWPLMNRCVAGQFMAASTIKPLSVYAALEHGIATAEDSYLCSGWWTGLGEEYGKYCWEHNGHGYMNLSTGITYSCDVVFYEIGKGFYYSDEPEGLQETFRKWCLGEATGIDLPSEATGRVPDAEWKWNYFTSYPETERTWQPGDTANIAIGQGDVLVTPLQMCAVYMGIANDGIMWRPHLLKSINAQSGDGSVIEYKNEVMGSPEELEASRKLVKDALLGVIYEESYDITSHFTNLSVTVAGKTGSGERTGEEATGWFCAYAPAEDPKYVVTAVVEQGGFGATCALYAVRDTLGAIYDEPDTVSVGTSVLN